MQLLAARTWAPQRRSTGKDACACKKDVGVLRRRAAGRAHNRQAHRAAAARMMVRLPLTCP